MSSVKNYFNKVADRYNDNSSKGIWAIFRKLESEAVKDLLDPFQKMTCVELGCGSGFYTKYLASFNPTFLVAVDLSENMLKEINILRVKRVRGDIQNIKFNIKFDRILCAGAIEFLADVNAFFANLKTLLSPTGQAILLMPRKGIFGTIYKVFHRSHVVKVSLYDIDQLEDILNTNHLRIEKIIIPTPMANVLAIVHK